MTQEDLDSKILAMQELIARLRDAADGSSLSQEEKEEIAAELKAVQYQIRRITRSL